MDLSGYTGEEIKLVASKLYDKYGPFEIRGSELVFSDNPKLDRETFEPEILDILRTDAIKQIDMKAELERGKILTPGDGQKIAYAYKYLEALDILKQPKDAELKPENYIMLNNELQLHTANPLTLRQMAAYVMDRVNFTKKAFSFIEVRRYTIRNKVAKAKTKKEVQEWVTTADFKLPDSL